MSHGFESMRSAFYGMLKGDNIGKALVKVTDGGENMIAEAACLQSEKTHSNGQKPHSNGHISVNTHDEDVFTSL